MTRCLYPFPFLLMCLLAKAIKELLVKEVGKVERRVMRASPVTPSNGEQRETETGTTCGPEMVADSRHVTRVSSRLSTTPTTRDTGDPSHAASRGLLDERLTELL